MQDDEREALISIYEGDSAFKQVNPTTYQYKVIQQNTKYLKSCKKYYPFFQYGEENDQKSFLVELTWGAEYPNVLPTINVDMFYNRNL